MTAVAECPPLHPLFDRIVDAYRGGYADIARLFECCADLVRPPEQLAPYEWADKYRILPSDAPEPGPWKTERVPYTRAIYDAFTDEQIERVIVVMGSQMSKTETILNLIGYWFSIGPVLPVCYVGPTQKQVSSMSTDRFSKMIGSTAQLSQRLTRGQKDKVAEKFIAGVRLGFAWAGSATELASHPNARVLVDERDRMLNDVDGEGDPVEIVAARMDAYANGTLGVFSTPTIEGASPSWTLYEEGTMMKWAWPCVHCYKFFIPSLALLYYPKDKSLHDIRMNARVACPHCGGEHEDTLRRRLNADGMYIPHVLNAQGDHVAVDSPVSNTTASFWVSGLASPFVSFGQRAERIAKAYQSKEPERIQAAINTGFGELFRMRGDAPKWEEIMALVRPVERMVVPEWATMLTMGTDVQRDGLFYVIRAWGFDKEINAERSHLVDNGYIYGDTEFDDCWVAWQGLLFHEFQHLRETLTVQLGLTDSGFNPSRDRYKRPEHKVYEICRRTGWRALPSKGHDTQKHPVIMSKPDRLPSGIISRGGLKIWHVDTDHFKSWLHAAVHKSLEQDDPVWTVHKETDEDYARQVTAEELVVKPSGKRVWICPNHRPNHYLDCEVLARAAAYIHRARLLPASSDQRDDKPAQPDVSEPGYIRRPEGSYFGRVGEGSYFRR